MIRNRRRYARLAAAGAVMALLLALTACGGSGGSQAAAGPAVPAARVAAVLSQLQACLGRHGVQVPSPVTRRAIRASLKSVPTARRESAISGCQKYIDALLGMIGKKH